jgi:hypothetical protein
VAVEHLVFFVEEPSAEAALVLLLPKMLRQGVTFEIQQFSGKDDLLQKLPIRLRGYANWLPASSRIVVLVDRDDEDCVELKARLEDMASQAGLNTWTRHGPQEFQVCNRILVEELEAWFFGDWLAVLAAYPRADRKVTGRAGYRDPDAIAGGTWEALERVLQKAGYYSTGLPKITVAREVATHMEPARNTSSSFQKLRQALMSM